MLKLSYEPKGINNFHNQPAINLSVSGEKMETYDGLLYVISPGQAKKIGKHFCGMKSCGCPKGAAIQLEWDRDNNPIKFGILVKWCQ